MGFKFWRPDLSEVEYQKLRPTIFPLLMSLHDMRLRVGAFRSLTLNAYKQFFLNYILRSAIKFFKYATTNYTKLPVHLLFIR